MTGKGEAFVVRAQQATDKVVAALRAFDQLTETIAFAGDDEMARIKREAAAYRKAIFGYVESGT